MPGAGFETEMMTRQHQDAPPTSKPIFAPPLLSPDALPEMTEFWRLWKEEKFFECHEALEELWRETTGPQRWFLNGLINCAVAIYQHRRGNSEGAARQLRRAQIKLEPSRPSHDGLDVDGLLESVAREVESSCAALSASQRARLEALRKSIEERMAPDFPGFDFDTRQER